MSETAKRFPQTTVQLDEVFRTQPGQPLLREFVRDWFRTLTRNEAAGAPLTGTYFWIPRPDDHGGLRWQIKEFFDRWQPGADPAEVWPHVRDCLEAYWNRDLSKLDDRCLPRGRVQLATTHHGDGRAVQQPVIDHGGDCPLGTAGLGSVRHQFQLQSNVPTVLDDGQQMVVQETQMLAEQLGIELPTLLAQVTPSVSPPMPPEPVAAEPDSRTLKKFYVKSGKIEMVVLAMDAAAAAQKMAAQSRHRFADTNLFTTISTEGFESTENRVAMLTVQAFEPPLARETAA